MPEVFAVACFCNQNMGRSTTGPRRDRRLDGPLQLGPFILLSICLSFLVSVFFSAYLLFCLSFCVQGLFRLPYCEDL